MRAVASSHNGGGEGWGTTATIWSEAQKAQILAQLAKVLSSSHFRSSKRCSLFLRYVVEHAVENQLDYLKERSLGIAVFERDPHYDTNQDPVVRSTAGEVRKRLAQHYLELGREEELRIGLPTGSYVPEIHFPVDKTLAVSVAVPARRFARRNVLVSAGAIVLVIAAVYGLLSWRRSGLERFWDPVVAQPGPILICMGQPRSYGFLAQRQGQVEKWFEHRSEGKVPPPELATVPLDEIVPLWDRYIDLLDTQGYERMASMFYSRGRSVSLRGDRSVSLSELRGRPAVLIGAFNNDWTLSLAGELRFCFRADPPNHASLVFDRQSPNKSDWRVVNAWPYGKIPADYAIVTRVRNPTTEQTVVIAAGITHFGTRAAAEFLTDERYFQQALKGAPRDWARKNMQIVLAVKVMSGAGGPPEVLASYFW
jgi:hypothetical protein